MARAMRASVLRNPNAMRVMSRIFGVDRFDAAVGQAVLDGGQDRVLS